MPAMSMHYLNSVITYAWFHGVYGTLNIRIECLLCFISCIPLYYDVLYDIILYHSVLCSAVLCCTLVVLYNTTVPYFTILCYTASYCAMLCHAVLSLMRCLMLGLMPCKAMFCQATLYHTVLWHAILGYILYERIRYNTVHCSEPEHCLFSFIAIRDFLYDPRWRHSNVVSCKQL